MSNRTSAKDEQADVLYSALKSVVGGTLILFSWAVSPSAGQSPVLVILGSLGAWSIGSELRETGVSRIIFSITLVGAALITWMHFGGRHSTFVVALLGLALLVLIYEVGRRRVPDMVRGWLYPDQ